MPQPGAPWALNGVQFNSVSGIAPSTVCWLHGTGSALPPCWQPGGLAPGAVQVTPRAEHGELSWDVKAIQEETKVLWGWYCKQAKKKQQPEQRHGAVLVFPF